uniref:ClpA/ClpB AAA lid domain-containing protein n=1 Tax=Zea mays TaxID=4577 RepID=A0A804LME4_MAIZE
MAHPTRDLPLMAHQSPRPRPSFNSAPIIPPAATNQRRIPPEAFLQWRVEGRLLLIGATTDDTMAPPDAPLPATRKPDIVGVLAPTDLACLPQDCRRSPPSPSRRAMPAVIPASARPTSTNLLCRCPPAHRHPSPAAATDDLPRPPQGGFCKRACRGSYRRARRGTRTRRRPRGCWRTSSPSRSTLGPPTRSFWPRNGGGDAAPSRPSAGGRTNEFHAATLHLPRRRCPPRTCDRFLPDKAIDLIDEAGSRVRLRHAQLPDEAKELDKELRQISKQKNKAVRGQDFEKNL